MIIVKTRIKIATQLSNVRQALARTMLRIVIGLQAYVVTRKLSGDPLHHRSGNLARAIVYSVTDSGSEITGTVGVSRQAPYGQVHELGGDYPVPAHQRRSVLGNIYSVRSYLAHYPMRAFLRPSFAENDGSIREQLGAAVGEGIRQ